MRLLSKVPPAASAAIALLALFVALGGAGYAAATVGSAQVKNNSLRGKDIRNGTITGRDVRNSGLAGRDVKNNSLSGRDIAEGKLGEVPRARSADTVRPNGVNNAAIQNGAVTTNKIADNAVTTPKIADGAVTTPKIADFAIDASKVGTVVLRTSGNQSIAGAAPLTAHVTCPAGSRAISGGGGTDSPVVYGLESYPSGNGWSWRAHNTDTVNSHTIYAVALCLL